MAAQPVHQRIIILVVAILFVLLTLHLLRGALWPFLAGMVIAYLLDPVADKLEEWKLPRGLAALTIVASFLIVVTLITVLLVPVLVAQVAGLVAKLPEYFDAFRDFARPLVLELEHRIDEDLSIRLRQSLQDISGDVFAAIGNLLSSMLRGGLALANLISIAVIMPLVAFYLLRDWDKLVAHVDSLLPRSGAPVIRQQLREIDERLSGFIRGQSLVCLVLAIWYAIGLKIVGLDFGLIVGLGAGMISFVPYIGTVVGLGSGLGLAFAQFDDPLAIASVAIVFASGQILQDFFLVPKLVGERVGLHPAWVLFALMAGGTLLGFTGILLAVPAAAVIGVVVRFAVERYKASDLYDPEHRGPIAATEEPPDSR